MYSVLVLFLSFVLWIASEKTLLHFSRTARRLFWYLLACAIGVVLVRWLQSLEGIGMMWVFLSAIMAASMIEDEVVKSKGLTLMDIEATQRLRARLRTPEAQARVHTGGKAERLMDIVGTISHGRGATLGARQLWARMSGTMRRLRRALHALLQQAEADELNYILCTINAPAMVEVCSRATMDLLTRERLPELTTETRAVLVDAVQKVGMRYRPGRQLWAAAVLLSTHGLELTLLKNYLDDGGDYHTCYKLCYNDLQGSLQARVLEHLAAEGRTVMAEFAALAPGGPPGAVLKLLSDVDDTVFSSGGSFPAGSDTRYPKKCYYPGALALYAELDRAFARRTQGPLARLRAAQRPQPVGLPPLPAEGSSPEGGSPRATPPLPPAAAALPGSSPRAGIEQDAAQAVADVEAERAEAERAPQSMLAAEPTFSLKQNGLPEEPAAAGATTAAADPAGAAGAAQALPGAGSQPLLRHTGSGSGSFGRPPRSPRPVPRPRPLALSPQSFRGLPAGEPLLSPTGTSPRSSSGPGEESLAGSIWGASSLATAQRGPFSFAHSGSAELADTLTSRLRPLGMTESEAYRKYFQPFVQRGDLDTSPTMLLGAMTSGPKALLQWLGVVTWFPALAPPEDPKTAVAALYQQLAAKKLSRFREYAALFPEACFVLIGDNGQGDVLCAEILWSSMRQNLPPGERSRLLCCLMHKVVPTASTYSMLRSSKTSKTGWQAAWQQRGIHFAKSHVGMALQAYTDGLLDSAALHRVCIAAAADFRRVWARYGGRHAGRNLGKALKHLNTDLRAANYVLPPRMQVPPLSIPGLAEGESLRGSRLPPPSPARSEALSDMSAFGQSVLH
ncbi:hypothetical protein COHA_008906 [Chlorella ohadii]|uniref:Uncharacterized protein n=1 Tax=Chlorella ohadii TaxID=2649997 RepID=A0AAD5H2T6_9CHLO|nr:hypothetical protein COHA_008906 [Chlorella ohadii]